MPPPVDDKARGADDVHRLVNQRIAAELACRQQQIGEQDERGTKPADDLDREVDRAQAESFRSTYGRMPPAWKYSSSL